MSEAHQDSELKRAVLQQAGTSSVSMAHLCCPTKERRKSGAEHRYAVAYFTFFGRSPMPLPRCLMPPPKTRKARWMENDGVWKPPPSLAHHGCRPKSGPGCQLKCRPGPTASSGYKSGADGWRTPTRCHPAASGPMPCVLPDTLRDAQRPGRPVTRI